MEFKKEVLSGYMDWRVTSFWMIIKAMGRRSVTWEGRVRGEGGKSRDSGSNSTRVVFNLGNTFGSGKELENTRVGAPPQTNSLNLCQ